VASYGLQAKADADAPEGGWDQPPRAVKLTKPTYPDDAYHKKIEGTVEVEFLIGRDGRVVYAYVLKSIPALDVAALQTVAQWAFSPARRGGEPVATIARAPVTFRIY